MILEQYLNNGYRGSLKINEIAGMDLEEKKLTGRIVSLFSISILKLDVFVKLFIISYCFHCIVFKTFISFLLLSL